MRIWSLVALALTLGVAIGNAGTIIEFGMVPPPPQLSSSSPPSSLRPLLSPASATESAPRVTVDNAEFDFGTMGQEGTGKHTFVFTNEGKGPLQLKVGDPPCKCTVGQLSKTHIPPGETAEVTVEFKPGHMKGRFSRTVPIHTNDPLVSNGVIQLTISGKVVPVLGMVPDQFLAYNIPPETSRELSGILYAYHSPDMKIVGHRLSDESIASYFEFSFEALPESERQEPLAVAAYRVTLEILPGLPMGRFSQSLIVETDDPQQPETTIEILGNITSAISIAGSGFDQRQNVMTIGTVPRGKETVRRFNILIRDESLQDIQLEVAEVNPASLQVELGKLQEFPSGGLQRIPLTVKVPADAPSGSYFGIIPAEMGKIVIKTNYPDQPEIVIYVRLIVEG